VPGTGPTAPQGVDVARLDPPSDTGTAQRIALVHADYRTGNFLAAPTGWRRGILD